MSKRRVPRLGCIVAFCGLLVAAWTLARSPAGSDAATPFEAPLANRATEVTLKTDAGELRVPVAVQ